MKILVFSIFDEKAQVFGNPFFMPHKGQALRAFSDLVNDGQSSVNKHPEDYKLYVVAEFDDISGGFVSLPQPEFLNNATDYITK